MSDQEKNVPMALNELAGRARYLVDALLALKQTYAMLHPTLFDIDVVERYGTGPRMDGFNIIRRVLFLSCAQDIVKLSWDGHDDAPSVKRLMGELQDTNLRSSLREEFATRRVLSNEEQTGPVALFALSEDEMREQTARRQRFEQKYSEAVLLWKQLSGSSALFKFRTIRNKLSAHTELACGGFEYQRVVEIEKLKLRFEDWQDTILLIQEIVERILALVCKVEFRLDGIWERELSETSLWFWGDTDG